jgi:hypothetical protein
MPALILVLCAAALSAACRSSRSNGAEDGAVRPSTQPARAAPSEREGGWRPIFDGRTTAGWRAFGGEGIPDGWRVEDGALARVGPAGDIVTKDEFGDFVLECEWRIAPGGNSGIFFHVAEGHDHVWETGPEYQILDDAAHRDGLDPKTSAGSNYALHAPEAHVARPAGEWNHARIEVRGPRVRHWLNGVQVVEYELWSPDWEQRVAASKFASMPDYGRAKRGHVALQDHGDPVWFRALRIRPLD